MSITKTDKADARLLAKYGQANNPPVSFTKPISEKHQSQEFKRLALMKKQLLSYQSQLEAFSFEPEPNEYLIAETQNDIDMLEGKILDLEKRLNMTMDESKAAMVKQLQSIKGIGPKTAMLIVLVTDGFRNFDNVKKLMKFLGLAVVQRESGKKRSKGVICKTGLPDFRQSLYMAARAAIRCNKDCQEQYNRLRNNGKPHKVALIAVCQKLVKQMYGIAKSGQLFDNDYYLRWSEAK